MLFKQEHWLTVKQWKNLLNGLQKNIKGYKLLWTQDFEVRWRALDFPEAILALEQLMAELVKADYKKISYELIYMTIALILEVDLQKEKFGSEALRKAFNTWSILTIFLDKYQIKTLILLHQYGCNKNCNTSYIKIVTQGKFDKEAIELLNKNPVAFIKRITNRKKINFCDNSYTYLINTENSPASCQIG